MQILDRLECIQQDEIVLTIGSFDGLHLGHQYLIRALVGRAHETSRLAAALTFEPHPRQVLAPDGPPKLLSTRQERDRILADLGLDLLLLLPFTKELARTDASTFIVRLRQCMRMSELWVGADFGLGRSRGGNTEALADLATRMAFELRVLEPVLDDGVPISSTRIRQMIETGDMDGARRLLGRCYALSGRVVPGARRGRQMGFRTANMHLDSQRALPRNGVYAVWAVVEGCPIPGVANLGIRPSFDNDELLLETHLIDFEGDLYGQELQVEFVSRLRPEMRFDRMEQLVRQMDRDVVRARELLSVKA